MQEKVNCRCKIFLNFMISEIKYKRNNQIFNRTEYWCTLLNQYINNDIVLNLTNNKN